MAKCKYETCNSKSIYNSGLGYCQKHYLRYKNNTLNLRENTKNILYLGEDVESQVYKPVTYNIEKNDCWIITSHSTDKNGYAYVRREIRGVIVKKAHRASYMYYNGDLNADELVRHLCNNPSCVNPNHLAKGSHQDNMNDRKEAGHYIKNHGKRKLTEEKVLEVVRLRKEGLTYKLISEQLDINSSTVSDILKGRTWSHITGIKKVLNECL